LTISTSSKKLKNKKFLTSRGKRKPRSLRRKEDVTLKSTKKISSLEPSIAPSVTMTSKSRKPKKKLKRMKKMRKKMSRLSDFPT
jgi:hypothetical protein